MPTEVPETKEEEEVKLILLGDSAVGKTKMVERFLMDEYNPQQLSTYALTLFRKSVDIRGRSVTVNIWDTAGQERFNKMHPAYYHGAHACIICFDVTRKATYQHLPNWYAELRESCGGDLPVLVVANKIDVDYQVTRKNFKFASARDLPLYFVSAADGTNVVKVFMAAIEAAVDWKDKDDDFVSDVLRLVS